MGYPLPGETPPWLVAPLRSRCPDEPLPWSIVAPMASYSLARGPARRSAACRRPPWPTPSRVGTCRVWTCEVAGCGAQGTSRHRGVLQGSVVDGFLSRERGSSAPASVVECRRVSGDWPFLKLAPPEQRRSRGAAPKKQRALTTMRSSAPVFYSLHVFGKLTS